jgi:hypothetical protein
MAHEPHPDDPYRARNPSRPKPGDDDLHREARLERDLQIDAELAEGPASGGKIVLFALGIALVLGAVFYGLNNTSMQRSGTSSTTQSAAPVPAQNAAPATAQNAAPTSPPAAPPGMRDVTPRANTGPGTTTGAAPSQTPPPSAPATNNAPASK